MQRGKCVTGGDVCRKTSHTRKMLSRLVIDFVENDLYEKQQI